MDDSEKLRYRVNVKSLNMHPAVLPNGSFTYSVKFHAEPLDNGVPFELISVVGDETLRRCHLLQDRVNITVEAPEIWQVSRPSNWQEEIVNAALAKAAEDLPA
jgi:hypothetical protein